MTDLRARLEAMMAWDDHTAETQANDVYGEGGWLSDEGIAYAGGARYQYNRDLEVLRKMAAALVKADEALKALDAYPWHYETCAFEDVGLEGEDLECNCDYGDAVIASKEARAEIARLVSDE